MNNVIELNNVSYIYPNSENLSLKNVNFSVKKGAFVVIMGHTGAGKTTLNLCLNGLIPQLMEGDLSGEIIVADRNLATYFVQDMAKHIGLVLDDPETQIFGRTVYEDTSFGPVNLALPLEEINQRVKKALNMVRLNGYEERDTSQLSGGEKQRLAIAGILALQPEILVLDEPTSELDPVGITEIYDTIDNLRLTKQLTILVTEHNSQEIINRVDRVVALKHGELAWQGKPDTLFRNIPLLVELGIRPVPVSLIGWDFYQKGLISFDQIPLDILSGEKMIRDVLERTTLSCRSTNNFETKFTRQPVRKSPALVQVSNLTYQYSPDNNALKNINLTIHEGEFVALIGSNGSGKTTLTKQFNGLLKPSVGQVMVNGMETKQFSTSQLSHIVGYVFQNPDHQIFCATVEKELEYGLKNAPVDTREINRRVNHVLNFTGLEQYRNEHPLSLGKGERQMIAVASILVLEPKILVIDEPTTGLDWAGIQKMMSLIKHLHENGTTILMISHDMEIVAKYAQRAIVMNDGEILLDGDTREVFSKFQVLEQACLVPPQITRLTSSLRDLGFETNLLHEQEFIDTVGHFLQSAESPKSLESLEDLTCL